MHADRRASQSHPAISWTESDYDPRRTHPTGRPGISAPPAQYASFAGRPRAKASRQAEVGRVDGVPAAQVRDDNHDLHTAVTDQVDAMQDDAQRKGPAAGAANAIANAIA